MWGCWPYIPRGTHNIKQRYTRPYTTYIRIYVYGRVYLRLILCVPRGILGITMERRSGQYSVTNYRNVGAMLGCRCDVSAFDVRRSICRLSKIDVTTFEDRCIEDRRSMCRPSRIGDVRRWLIDVPSLEDG